MSRDFLLIVGGGAVSLVTTLVVLFIAEFILHRNREDARLPREKDGPHSGRWTNGEQG